MRKFSKLPFCDVKFHVKEYRFPSLINISYQESKKIPRRHLYTGKTVTEGREAQQSFKTIDEEMRGYCNCESCKRKVNYYNPLRSSSEERSSRNSLSLVS